MTLRPTPLSEAYDRWCARNAASNHMILAAGKPEVLAWWAFMAGFAAGEANAVRRFAETSMDLTPHFTLAEMTASSAHPDIPNDPSAEIIAHLGATAALMERVRQVLGNQPITVSSGYRSPALNAAVGGVPNDAHEQGWGCDFECPAFGAPLTICRALAGSGLVWDQLIEEGTWVHLSADPRARGQVLTKAPGGGYRVGLPD